MKRAGMLSASTDVEELAKKAFVHLDGVNDGWIEKLQIAQLPGGRVPADQPMRLAAELATQRHAASRSRRAARRLRASRRGRARRWNRMVATAQ